VAVLSELVVITGAGASHACSEKIHGSWRPPLTAGLFSGDFLPILRHYPRALAAAQTLDRHADREHRGAIGLETYLRDRMRDSPHVHRRQQFREIPLYLQELLWEIGRSYGDGDPENYNALVTSCLDLESVSFVTLNYDTILDERLFAHWGRLEKPEDYVVPDRSWCLIKPHGSVNWGHRVRAPGDAVAPGREANAFFGLGDDLDETVEDEIVLVKEPTNIAHLRHDPDNGEILLYPALSVPLGPGDTFACPKPHLTFLQERLAAAAALDLLVIGYSALDEQILGMLRESGKRLRSLFVVGPDQDACSDTQANMVRELGGPPMAAKSESGGFNAWARTGAMELYFEKILPDWRSQLA
jgi:hypothetical protein